VISNLKDITVFFCQKKYIGQKLEVMYIIVKINYKKINSYDRINNIENILQAKFLIEKS
jgi:hypothetical protein